MFNCHAHPGLYTKNALVCTASVDEISRLSQFPYRSLGSLPGFNTDLSTIEKWAEKETFIGEIGVDKRFENKERQFSILSDILSLRFKRFSLTYLSPTPVVEFHHHWDSR